MAEPILNGATRRLLKEALFSAFGTPSSLDQMLKLGMDVSLAEWRHQAGRCRIRSRDHRAGGIRGQARGTAQSRIRGEWGDGITRVRPQFAPEG
jgi:hypothetical protein